MDFLSLIRELPKTNKGRIAILILIAFCFGCINVLYFASDLFLRPGLLPSLFAALLMFAFVLIVLILIMMGRIWSISVALLLIACGWFVYLVLFEPELIVRLNGQFGSAHVSLDSARTKDLSNVPSSEEQGKRNKNNPLGQKVELMEIVIALQPENCDADILLDGNAITIIESGYCTKRVKLFPGNHTFSWKSNGKEVSRKVLIETTTTFINL